MNADIAALAFQVDSSDAQRAVLALQALKTAAGDIAQQKQALLLTQQYSAAATELETQRLKDLQQQLQISTLSFDGMLKKLQEVRAAFDGSTQAFGDWTKIQQQVDAVGRAFGTTAAGVANYVNATQQLGFTSTQTATSLQKITLALENQTAAGAALRQTMAEVGVNLSDLKVDQTAEAFNRLVSAVQKVGDTAQRTRAITQVLGNLDPDVMGRVVSPNYQAIADRQMQAPIIATQNRILDNYATAQRIETPVRQAQEQLDIAGQQFSVPGQSLSPYSKLTPENMDLLRRNAPAGSAFLTDGISTQAGQLALAKMIQGIDLRPTISGGGPVSPADTDRMQLAELATHLGRTPNYNVAGQGYQTFMGLFDGNSQSNANTPQQYDPANASPLTRFSSRVSGLYNYAFGGEEASNTSILLAQRDKEAANHPNDIGNFFSRNATFLGRQLLNKAGIGIDPALRPVDETIGAAPMDQAGNASAAAGMGDARVGQYQQARTRALSLGMFGSSTAEKATEDTRLSTAQSFFKSIYGDAEGSTLASQGLTKSIDDMNAAITPNYAAIQSSRVGLGLQSVGFDQRGKVQALTEYARGQGIPDSALAGKSEDDIRGMLSGRQRAGFDTAYSNNTKLSSEGFNEQFQQRAGDQIIAGSVANGGTASQDQLTYLQAYRQALKDVGTAMDENGKQLEAERRAKLALVEVDLQRQTTQKNEVELLKSQNDQTKTYNETLAPAGIGGAERDALGLTAGLQQQAAARRLASGQDQTDWITQQQNKFGVDAIKQAQDLSAASEQEYENQIKITGAMTQRQAVAEKMQRDLQVETSFQSARAKALADGADTLGRTVQQIDALIAKTKEAKDATAALTAEAKAYGAAMQANQQANTTLQIASLPPSQQGLAQRLAPINQAEQNATLAGGTQAPDIAPEQRALLDTLAGPESGGRYDIRWNGLRGPQATFDTNGQHPNVRVENSTAAGRYMFQAGTWNQFAGAGTPMTPANQDNAALKDAQTQWTKAGGGDLLTDLQDPNKLGAIYQALSASEWTGIRGMGQVGFTAAYNANVAANRNPTDPTALHASFDAQRAAETRLYNAENTAQAQTLTTTFAGNTANRAQQTAALANNQTGQAAIIAAGNVDPSGTDPNRVLKAQQAQEAARQQLAQQFIADQAQMKQETADQTRLADAYRVGGAALVDLQAHLAAEADQRGKVLDKTQAQADAVNRLNNERAKENNTMQQTLHNLDLDNQKVDANLAMGPIASQKTVDRAQAQLQAQQDAQKNFPLLPDKQAGYVQDVLTNFDKNVQLKDLQSIRDTFGQIGQQGLDALNNIIVNGGKAKDVLASLTKSVADLLLKAAEKPLADAAGSWFSNLLGLGSKATGVAGAAAGTAGSGAVGSGLGLAVGELYARGGAFDQGMRFLATGDVLDRPTKFWANGGPNMAGEVGPEAIMPLRRMPNGDLGVAGGSGGGGSSVVVHAPINIQGSAGDGRGGVDPATAAALQRHIQESVRVGVIQVIASERRPGGSLYGANYNR